MLIHWLLAVCIFQVATPVSAYHSTRGLNFTYQKVRHLICHQQDFFQVFRLSADFFLDKNADGHVWSHVPSLYTFGPKQENRKAHAANIDPYYEILIRMVPMAIKWSK